MATARKRPSAIVKLSEAPSSGKFNWLIFAESGTGKTVLCGTAPRALFLTVEAAGTESAKMFGSEADEWVIDTKQDLDAAYEYFSKGSGCRDYDWVILDSLSEIEDMFWANLQGDSMTKKLQQYGEVETMIKKEVARWNKLKVNVIYTATAARLDTEDVETEEDETLLIPSVGTKNGKLAMAIAAKVSLVGYLSVKTREGADGEEEEYRRLQLKKSDRVIAKDRHGITLNGALRNPTIPKMIEKVGSYKPLEQSEESATPATPKVKKNKKENV